MLKTVKVLLILCYSLMAGACATETVVREEFDKSIKAYNRLLRWQEMEAAGMVYIEPQQRENFLKSIEAIKKKGVTITDYRILTMECLPEKGTGEAVTEFDYYILPSNRIKTLTYRQKWSYREADQKKSWKLKDSLPEFK